MLPDIKYKVRSLFFQIFFNSFINEIEKYQSYLLFQEALTETFVVHYSRIAMILEKTSDPDTLSNRIVHVSVQLFSNEKLAVRMTEKFCLLQVMAVSLKNMMSRILIPRSVACEFSTSLKNIILKDSYCQSLHRFFFFSTKRWI